MQSRGSSNASFRRGTRSIKGAKDGFDETTPHVLHNPFVESARVDRCGAIEGVDRSIDIVVAVGIADDEGWREDPARNHLLHEQGSICLRWRLIEAPCSKNEIAGTTKNLKEVMNAIALSDFLRTAFEPLALPMQRFDDGLRLVDLHRGDTGCQRVRLGPVRSGKQKDAFLRMIEAAAYHQV